MHFLKASFIFSPKVLVTSFLNKLTKYLTGKMSHFNEGLNQRASLHRKYLRLFKRKSISRTLLLSSPLTETSPILVNKKYGLLAAVAFKAFISYVSFFYWIPLTFLLWGRQYSTVFVEAFLDSSMCPCRFCPTSLQTSTPPTPSPAVLPVTSPSPHFSCLNKTSIRLLKPFGTF